MPAGAQLTAIGSDDRTHGVDAAFLMDDDIPCFTCRTESSIWARCRATATTASAAGLEKAAPLPAGGPRGTPDCFGAQPPNHQELRTPPYPPAATLHVDRNVSAGALASGERRLPNPRDQTHHP